MPTKIPMMLILACLLFFSSIPVHSQVNTEKLRRSDAIKGVAFTSGFTLGLQKGNSDFVSAAVAARVDWVRSRNDNFLVLQYDFMESDAGKIANKGFLHLRSMWEVSALLSLEGFTQFEFNEFTSLTDRELLGGGIRLHFLAVGDDSAGASLNAYLGVGAMFEHEHYTTHPSDVVYDRLRSTNYLTLNSTFDSRTALRIIAYYQPLLQRIGDYRLISDASLEFRLTTALTFTLTTSYRYNSNPVLNVRQYDLHIRNGLRITLP
ncbi:MAG: DUF481 domain-containing protein [Bacteroidetes bacterium]|nr:DUF481 domain-containing protein [Bacteroidota bacterium]